MFVGWVAPLPGALAVLVPDERDELAELKGIAAVREEAGRA